MIFSAVASGGASMIPTVIMAALFPEAASSVVATVVGTTAALCGAVGVLKIKNANDTNQRVQQLTSCNRRQQQRNDVPHDNVDNPLYNSSNGHGLSREQTSVSTNNTGYVTRNMSENTKEKGSSKGLKKPGPEISKP